MLIIHRNKHQNILKVLSWHRLALGTNGVAQTEEKRHYFILNSTEPPRGFIKPEIHLFIHECLKKT